MLLQLFGELLTDVFFSCEQMILLQRPSRGQRENVECGTAHLQNVKNTTGSTVLSVKG